MEIACVKTVNYAPTTIVQCSSIILHCPIAGQRPVVGPRQGLRASRAPVQGRRGLPEAERAAENRALERARKALRLRHINPFENEEPFAVVIRCTADREKVDKRTRSKWSRALRYALVQKTPSESLVQFIKRKGGINRCAERFRAHQRGRPSRLLSSE